MSLTVFTGPLPSTVIPAGDDGITPPTLVGGSIEMPDFAYDFYMSMEPLQFAEHEVGYQLAQYCMAIGEMFRRVDEVARQGEYAVIMDPATVPDAGIRWLGQFLGVRILPAWTEAEQRAALIDHNGFMRGTPEGMARAAQQWLSGSQTVMLFERYLDNPWHLHVVTLTAETMNAELVLKALMSQKPAGIILTHQVTDVATYDSVEAENADYDAVETAYPTYDDMAGGAP